MLSQAKGAARYDVTRWNVPTWRAAIVLSSVVILTAILWLRLPGQTMSLKVGDTAPDDIRSPVSTLVLDQGETERRREKAAASVAPRYPGIDPSVKSMALERAQEVFDAIRVFQEGYPSAQERRAHVKDIKEQLQSARLPEDVLLTCLSADSQDVQEMAQATQTIVASVYDKQIRSGTDDLKFARQEIERKAREVPFPPPQARAYQNVVQQIAQRVVDRPNSMLDEQLTEQERERARRAVEPVYRPVIKGDLIVGQGEEITPEVMEKLTALGLVHTRPDWTALFSFFALATFLVGIIAVYVYQHIPQIYQETRLLCLLALAPLVALLAYKVGSRFPGLDYYLAVPVTATSAMLIAILLDARLSILVALTVSILTTLLARGDLPGALSMYLMSFGSAIVGIYSVSRIASRKQLINTGFALAGTNVFLCALSGALQGTLLADVLLNSVWGVGNGFVSVMVTLGAVMFLERPFGITTHLRLLELSDPNEPVLRRMQMEAPGTHTHSILVGNLAESAAKAIGADALLCRVACLYHDIGKLRRPYCFAENQFGRDNIHDRLNPTLSALAVIAHVKDGMEMARQFKLPQPVVDMIPQHHGTSLVSYFYQRAVESQGDGEVSEENFRYPGPKPQTKEAAIVMLADSVEAAARTLAKPTPHRIQQLVRTIITSRLEDGQLDECDLTLKDLDHIAQAFAHVLQGLLHSRVEYPDTPWGENKHETQPHRGAGTLPPTAQTVRPPRRLRRVAGRRS